jgi:hypothetical protein
VRTALLVPFMQPEDIARLASYRNHDDSTLRRVRPSSAAGSVGARGYRESGRLVSMDEREIRAAAETVRAIALIAAAIARIGTNASPAELMSVAEPLIPWITRPPARMLFAIAIEGEPEMPLTIDSVNSVAILSFEDRDEEAVAPPAGVLATVTSSDTAVLTAGAAVPGTDASGVANIQFPLTEVIAGTSTLTVTTTDASGNPLLGPDGVTPIPAPAPVVVTVNPGAPDAEVFTVPGD